MVEKIDIDQLLKTIADDSRLSDAACRLLGILWAHARGREWESVPSDAELAEACGWGPAAQKVALTLGTLERFGYLRRRHEATAQGGVGRVAINLYVRAARIETAAD